MKEALFIKKTIIEKLPNEWANTKLSCKWLNITYLCKNEEEDNKQKQNSWYCGVNFYRRFVLDKTHNNNKQKNVDVKDKPYTQHNQIVFFQNPNTNSNGN